MRVAKPTSGRQNLRMTTEPPARAETRRPGPLPALLAPLACAEPLYRWAVARRNAAFDRGERVWRAPFPVVSVGNLSVGGSGKSPVVARLARELLAHHRRPVIVMRGYRKRAGQPSDEEAEYAEAAPGVPVLAAPDRAGAIASFHAGGGRADCALLDDGFQHRFVARDLDIVLVDATRDPFADRCLPAGWLREPVESLRRAHAVVVTRADLVDRRTLDALRGAIARVAPSALLASCAHRWSRVDAFGEREGREPPEFLERRRVFVLSGIGNPGALRRQVERARAMVVGERALRDHAHYTPGLVSAITGEAQRAGGEFVLTTAKDWVKIRPLLGEARAPVSWLVPRVDVEFLDGVDALLARVLDVASRSGQLLPSPA